MNGFQDRPGHIKGIQFGGALICLGEGLIQIKYLAAQEHSMRTYLLLIFIFLFSSSSLQAQQPPSTNFYQNIKNYNLSRLWKADSIILEVGPEKAPFPEPLGFIGDNYQRFYIHYLSVTKVRDSPYVYKITGKTRVKNNICNFTGQIRILKAVLYKEPVTSEFAPFKNGSVTCQVTFNEDSTQYGSGVIKGTLVSNFYIDKKGKLYYDALMAVADVFSNNECTATWTSYKTGKSKTCNWGDYRIPESRQLDTGAGVFCVAEEYRKNGWESYYNAYSGPEATQAKAQAEEDREWWK